MDLLFKIEPGHSAEAVLIGNVVSYVPMDRQCKHYLVTYKDKGELWDVCIDHVQSVEEVNI